MIMGESEYNSQFIYTVVKVDGDRHSQKVA